MSKLWAIKHRPAFEDIVGQEDIRTCFENVNQHSIFYSQGAGTGKTSLAYALADKYGFTIHTFNASSKKTRGIEFVEEELLPMSRTGNYKQIFLLDEADQLTPAAQSALKGVIENSHGYFILTCNDLSKISDWLKSRCNVYHFKTINEQDMLMRLIKIASIEGVEITTPKIQMICDKHSGDLRAAINCLQAYHYSTDKDRYLLRLVDEGLDPQAFLTMCFREKDYEAALEIIDDGHTGRNNIRIIFRHAVNSNANVKSKLTVIDAAVTAERDYILGVEPNIILANFVRLCMDS